MFRRKKRFCPRCGRPVREDWEFCPYCGFRLKEEEIGIFEFPELFKGYRSIFEEIEKEFRRIDKLFSQDFFKIPEFREKPGMSGISIVIKSGTGMKPKIYVKTYGDYKKIEPEIRKRIAKEVGGLEEAEEEYEKVREIPKVTEEPKAEVRDLGNKIEIEVELPDVKSEKDIDVKVLEQSVEIRAFAKDKAYFKLLPIRPNGRLSYKKFENGKLKIGIEY